MTENDTTGNVVPFDPTPVKKPKKPKKPKKYHPKKTDFENGKVFEYLAGIDSNFERNVELNRLEDEGKKLGVKRIPYLWAAYQRDHKKKPVMVYEEPNISNFAGQNIDLDTGEWRCDETGVHRQIDQFTIITACTHPIMPVRRLISIDTNDLKYTIAFRRSTRPDRPWMTVDVPASDLFNPTEIVKVLAPRGVSVTAGERARNLVDYLRDIIDTNYERIPETRSISRLGWNASGFAPYDDKVTFDGAQTFAAAFQALSSRGDPRAWLEEAVNARRYSVTARIVLAASFAAPLIEKLGILSFFVHLWSVESGTGKTVAQMLGASVWGNPNPGGALFPTFRSTSVGIELIAGFLHSIPVFLDELQLAKDHHGNINFNVYELASGSGKLRGNRQLGLNYTPTWATTFITSGETPIVNETDGEGALNRVFEIECYSGQKVVEDGHRTSGVLRDNYGFAGAAFVKRLQEDGVDKRVKEIYDTFYQECSGSDTTEKQAMAASAILTADALATEWIFKDGNALKVSDIAEFLKTREAVSLLDRGYSKICDWVSVNSAKLHGTPVNGECFGDLIEDEGVVYIIRSVFKDVCDTYELSEKGMLSHLKTRNLLRLRASGGLTFSHRINGHPANCIAMILPPEVSEYTPDEEYPIIPDTDKLPF